MPTYAKDTSVSVASSQAEIEQTLRRYGATAFMYGWEQGRAVVGFEIIGRRYRISVKLPSQTDSEFTLTPARRTKRSQASAMTAWEQAVRQRWRALALYIKAILEANEAGIISIEQMLQPFTVLPNGSTVGEWMEQQIEAVYLTGRMPPMLPSGNDK